MKNHNNDRTDPILAYDFIAGFVNKTYMLNMSQAQAFIALPTFLAELAETQFYTSLSGSSRH